MGFCRKRTRKQKLFTTRCLLQPPQPTAVWKRGGGVDYWEVTTGWSDVIDADDVVEVHLRDHPVVSKEMAASDATAVLAQGGAMRW